MKLGFYVAVLAALAGGCRTASVKLPPYLKQCSKSDPKLDECVLKHGLEAIPTILKGDESLKIPVLDPLQLEEIKIGEGTGGVRFSLVLNKPKVFGLKHADVKGFKVDLKKQTINLKLEIPGAELYFLSKYVVDGKILILPIKGEGDMNLTLENVKAEFRSGYDLVKHADGLEYAKVKNSSLSFEIDRAYFDMKNLFNGDKALGDNMNLFLNENWRDVYAEVKPAAAEVVETLIVTILTNILDHVSYENIFLP